MNYRLQPVSRLTLVFILAVVVSGSILTWFSINNISNLKELTEKRILEEEQELATRFSLAMQDQIEGAIDGFQQQINPAGLFIDSLVKTNAKHDFIQQTFLLRNDGKFLYPNFAEIPQTLAKPNSSQQFNSIYSKGENAEFRENNFSDASSNYRSAMKFSKSASDSAKVLLALSRVSIKSGNTEKAVRYYIELITGYCSLTDAYGIPYVNFALQQFCKVSDTALKSQIVTASRDCLKKMAVGEIPLTYQTNEILVQFSDWTQTHFQTDDATIVYINKLISIISGQIDFVYQKKSQLIGLLEKNDPSKRERMISGFFDLIPTTGTSMELILLNADSTNIWGFLIKGNKLFETVLQEDLQNNLTFQYSVTFPARYNNNHPQYLTTVALLNPYFNQQTIQIKLNDETALQNIIRRRSWIYGIASVLLLVAMLLGVYLILRDIAREKRLSRLRSDFISNVTHELKTPLTSIYMFAESLLLRREKKPEMRDEYLSVILKESERLKRMINNILEFSKAEKGIPEYHFVESNISEIIYSAMHEMEYWLEKEQFEVNSGLDKDLVVSADQEKMKQAFLNLISNAIKYSNSKKQLDIRLYKSSSNIHIEFEDHGIGIPNSERPRIFDKFYRVDSAEGVSGTGLGLTVVKEIVEAHKGKVTVESQVGKGSKFSIILHQQEAGS